MLHVVGQVVLLPEQAKAPPVPQVVPPATGRQLPLVQLPQPWSHAPLQHTPSTQNPVAHCVPFAQLLPCGTRQCPVEQISPLWHWLPLAQAACSPCEP